jgi:hypothetical protein
VLKDVSQKHSVIFKKNKKNMIQKKKHANIFQRKAQSVIELSVLGAALLAILGLLIRYAAGISDSQNAQLGIMLEALQLSAQEGMNTSETKTKRNASASILRIDDKPTLEGGEKYGSTSFTPTISFGSGTFTNLLQYPTDSNPNDALPYMNIIINGQHFTFTTANYASINYEEPGNCLPFGDKFANLPKKPGARCLKSGTANCGQYYYWDQAFQTAYPYNFSAQYDTVYTIIPNSVHSNDYAWFLGPGGKQLMYWTRIPYTDKRFCYKQDDPGPACTDKWGSTVGCHFCQHINDYEKGDINDRNTLFNRRWTLDPVNLTNDTYVPFGARYKMAWQWFPVGAGGGDPVSGWGTQFLNGSDEKDGQPDPDGDDQPGDPLTFVDVDMDGHEEAVMEIAETQYYSISPGGDVIPCGGGICSARFSYSPDYNGTPYFEGCNNFGAIGGYYMADVNAKVRNIKFLDYQDGDLDMTYNKISAELYRRTLLDPSNPALNGKPKPGFVEGRAKIYTNPVVADSGQLHLSQRTLGSSTDHISTQTKNTSTIVERQIQLSNNTGRFDCACGGGGSNCQGGVVPGCCATYSGESCCNDASRYGATCFDKATNILYVRTLIESKVGHKYKTTD